MTKRRPSANQRGRSNNSQAEVEPTEGFASPVDSTKVGERVRGGSIRTQLEDYEPAAAGESGGSRISIQLPKIGWGVIGSIIFSLVTMALYAGWYANEIKSMFAELTKSIGQTGQDVRDVSDRSKRIEDRMSTVQQSVDEVRRELNEHRRESVTPPSRAVPPSSPPRH